MSRLDLVVGPNGAGKSTFIAKVLVPTWPSSSFVNADVIAAQRWPEDPESHSYEAAQVASETRSRLIELRRPLIAETVYSHPSKLELVDAARSAGYFVALHVIMVPEHLSLLRVEHRVASGGHSVPADKISKRYRRLWANVAATVPLASSATFWDNSGFDGPACVAMFIAGTLAFGPHWPGWTPDELTSRWPR